MADAVVAREVVFVLQTGVAADELDIVIVVVVWVAREVVIDRSRITDEFFLERSQLEVRGAAHVLADIETVPLVVQGLRDAVAAAGAEDHADDLGARIGEQAAQVPLEMAEHLMVVDGDELGAEAGLGGTDILEGERVDEADLVVIEGDDAVGADELAELCPHVDAVLAAADREADALAGGEVEVTDQLLGTAERGSSEAPAELALTLVLRSELIAGSQAAVLAGVRLMMVEMFLKGGFSGVEFTILRICDAFSSLESDRSSIDSSYYRRPGGLVWENPLPDGSYLSSRT